MFVCVTKCFFERGMGRTENGHGTADAKRLASTRGGGVAAAPAPAAVWMFPRLVLLRRRLLLLLLLVWLWRTKKTRILMYYGCGCYF